MNKDEIEARFNDHAIETPDSSAQEQQPREAVPNTQWQYIAIDLEGGEPQGTNDVKTAKEYAQSETFYVIHLPTCQTMHVLEDGTLEYHNIPAQGDYELE